MEDSKRGTRRRHDDELKRQVLDECAKPGASVAHVALAHGLNANLVHKWRRLAAGTAAVVRAGDSFVPVMVEPAVAASSAMPESIQLELQRGAVTVRVGWPMSSSAACASWLREIWR